MDKLEKVIKGLEDAFDITACDQSMTIVEQWVVRDALELLKARANDINYVTGERFKRWAEDIGVHFCATCKRRDCDCPIENDYALPLDGYCHLWNGRPTE